jgi:hypothetical protein
VDVVVAVGRWHHVGEAEAARVPVLRDLAPESWTAALGPGRPRLPVTDRPVGARADGVGILTFRGDRSTDPVTERTARTRGSGGVVT